MTPSVSVIIPVFNRESFIEACVESVLAQTHTDYELIVVDDGSTDQTRSRLAGYGSQIQLIAQAQGGVSAARNAGMQRARADWLTFLDSDDLWLPKKLSTQRAFLAQNPSCKICYTEEIWYRKGRRVNPARKHRKSSGRIYQQMLPLCLISPSSVMLHRSLIDQIGAFDESLPACEDYDLWLRIGARHAIALIAEPLIIKQNGHEGQLSRKYWGMDRFRLQSLIKMLESGVLSPDDEQATVLQLQEKCRILGLGYTKRGKPEEARRVREIARRFGLKAINKE